MYLKKKIRETVADIQSDSESTFNKTADEQDQSNKHEDDVEDIILIHN